MKKQYILLLFLVFAVSLCVDAQNKEGFVTVSDGVFYKKGLPYYYIGTNYWYGAILGSKGVGGNRKRLAEELDILKKHGVNNLRILVGAEGPNGEPFRVTPALQLSPGKYDEQQLDGLDYLLSEMKKRDQHAILYLGNSWEWSGGYAQYLQWNGYGTIPYPNLEGNGWPQFLKYIGEFHRSCDKCKEQYQAHIKFMLSRTNRYTGAKYVDDPTIMTWEIANEPRAFSKDNLPSYEKWIIETATFIKSVDPNHLVTSGTEGQHGSEGSMEAFERIHAASDIDYLTMHIWPKNWSWLDIHNIPGSVSKAITMTNQYMDDHIKVAEKLKKPIVLEEFGLPRDNHTFLLTDKTTARDQYYENAFQQIHEHAKTTGVLAGCNFWAFGGTARPKPKQPFWKKGDALMGDPPQEEQGLNSVFDVDTTMEIVKKYSKKLSEVTAQYELQGTK